MTFQNTPYTELLWVSAVVSGTLVVYALQRYRTASRNRRSLLYFAVLMLSAAVWSATYAIGLSEVEYGPKVFWLAVTNVATVVAPTAWLAFALSYADHDEYLTRRVWAALAVEPLVIVAAVTTTQHHDLYYISVERTFDAGFYVLARELGPLFVVHAAYSYVLVLAGAITFLQFVRLDEDTYRGQVALIVGGALLPVVSNAAFVLGGFGDHVNLTSVVLGVSGLMFAIAISRYRFFELAPAARETVVERMRDGYVVCDDGIVIDSNPAASELLDTPTGLVGEGLASVVPAIEDGLAAARRGEDYHDDLVRGSADDRQFVEATVSPLPAVGGTLVVLRDITDRRRTERRFQTLIEGSSDIITVLDADGDVQYVSPSIERILGIPPDAVVGGSVFETVHPEDSEGMRAAFEAGIEGSGFDERLEYRVPNESGEWRVHEAVARDLLDDPNVEGVVVTSRDVTERKERQRELETANEDLERTNERLERFASVVSHDLRNPLNVAEGYAELLDERVEGPEIEEIRESHARMRTIIDDVLALAKNTGDVAARSELSLVALANEAWENVDTADATLETTDGVVAGDRTRLVRAFENLFRNAIEHAGTDVTVSVGPLADGFYVADDGPGVP